VSTLAELVDAFRRDHFTESDYLTAAG